MPFEGRAASLSDSVMIAVSSHPVIRAKQASAGAADQGVWEQRAAFFPTVNLNGSTARVRQNDDTTRAATGGYASSWVNQGTVSLTQPLFTGFSNVNRFEAAQDRWQSAKYELGGVSEDVALRAARAHLNLMRTQELLDEASAYLQDIKKRRDSIKLMVKAGAADEGELLQADKLLLAAKSMRLDHQESYHRAEADYIEVVGTAPDGKLEFGRKSWEGAIPATLEQAVSAAVAESQGLKSAEYMVEALGKEAKAEGGALLPRVDAELSYTDKTQDNDFGGQLTSAQALLKLSWNISTGGAQMARRSKGLKEREAALARKEDILRTVEHDVRQKFVSMQMVDRQLELMKEGEESSKKLLSTLTAQFKAGKQSNLQIMGARGRLFEAKASRIDTSYRGLLARFELLSTMGRLQRAVTVAVVQDATSK